MKTDNPKVGYKLFRIRKDGTLGPLFINAKQRIPMDQWLEAETTHLPPKSTWKVRPGWHICHKPYAPHLTSTVTPRVWCKVLYHEATELPRPERLGGNWILAKYIKVLGILEPNQVEDMLSGKDPAQAFLDRILN